MTFAERREIEMLKKESNNDSKMVASEKYRFGVKLQNGLGKSIVSELRKPVKKPNKFKIFINKLKRLFYN